MAKSTKARGLTNKRAETPAPVVQAPAPVAPVVVEAPVVEFTAVEDDAEEVVEVAPVVKAPRGRRR